MHLALSAAAIGLFLWAAVSDMATRRIPNHLVVLLALVALARLGLAAFEGAGLLRTAGDLALGAAVFGCGALLFRFGLFGGGDVKLLAAGALWLGAGSALPFLASTAVAGGILAVCLTLYLAFGPGARTNGRSNFNTLPYGVAIAAGGVLATVLSF